VPQQGANWAAIIKQVLAILNALFPTPTPMMQAAQQAMAKCSCDEELSECAEQALKHLMEAALHVACLRDALDPPPSP